MITTTQHAVHLYATKLVTLDQFFNLIKEINDVQHLR